MENEWASFLLGRLYLYGTDDIPKDKEKAEEWLTMSASQGNEYAQNSKTVIWTNLFTEMWAGLFYIVRKKII